MNPIRRKIRQEQSRAQTFKRLYSKDHNRLIHARTDSRDVSQENAILRQRLKDLESVVLQALCLYWTNSTGEVTPTIKSLRHQARTLLEKSKNHSDGNKQIAADNGGTLPRPCTNGNNDGTMKPVENCPDNRQQATDTSGARVRNDLGEVAKSPNPATITQP